MVALKAAAAVSVETAQTSLYTHRACSMPSRAVVESGAKESGPELHGTFRAAWIAQEGQLTVTY
jgi:hypothetical protein